MIAGRMAEVARSGRMPGAAPVGYVNAREKGVGKAIERGRAHPGLLVEAFLMAAEGTTVRGVIAELTPRGLASRNGKPIGPSSMHKILTNPFYMGMVRYKGELVKGSHEAIVSLELFAEAQRRLKGKRRR